MNLIEAIAHVEKELPTARYNLGKPASWVDGFPPKFRRQNPYEAWISFGEFGRKGFVCVAGDGPTMEAALLKALELALKEKARYEEHK